ncbi:hypothetical protein PR202_gb26076 [Eleusine coracana subsp. coracana]|uniref:Uncharacterized protein n=1 Tax=Eleusine coracana subsp. coracana TaxID=191504 RepID=A0AAV5FRP1_ELECO|nr:hypothetical protein PR202_gb26076 [Eleusine coracana subsp. coracana]
MATTKMAMVAILAALLLMAAVEPASATLPSEQLAARKLQMPRLIDIVNAEVIAETQLGCIPMGGFCLGNLRGCCGSCGCLAGFCWRPASSCDS